MNAERRPNTGLAGHRLEGNVNGWWVVVVVIRSRVAASCRLVSVAVVEDGGGGGGGRRSRGRRRRRGRSSLLRLDEFQSQKAINRRPREGGWWCRASTRSLADERADACL